MERQSSANYFTRRELFHTWRGRPQCRVATCRVKVIPPAEIASPVARCLEWAVVSHMIVNGWMFSESRDSGGMVHNLVELDQETRDNLEKADPAPAKP